MPAKSTFLTVITILILIVLSWLNLLHHTQAAGAIAQGEPEPTELAGFHLISATDGWLQLGQHLYSVFHRAMAAVTRLRPPAL
jgi:hypothetical protein